MLPVITGLKYLFIFNKLLGYDVVIPSRSRNAGGNYGMSGFGRGSGGGGDMGGMYPMDMVMDMMHQNGLGGGIGFGRGGASVGGTRGYGGGGGMGFGRGAVSG